MMLDPNFIRIGECEPRFVEQILIWSPNLMKLKDLLSNFDEIKKIIAVTGLVSPGINKVTKKTVASKKICQGIRDSPTLVCILDSDK